MPNEQPALPAGGCAVCGRAALAPQLIGTRCANPLPLGPCTGQYRPTVAPTDWVACQTCLGKGAVGSQRCNHCEGSGWNYARPQFP